MKNLVHKFARLLTAIIAFGVIGTAGYYGLQTADAQSGGGYPSQPSFTSVTARQANAGTAKPVVVYNTTSGVAAATALDLRNNLNAGNHELELGYTSSAFSGSFLVNGPTGEAGFVYTPANQSLCVGTNGICTISINGATQAVTFPATGQLTFVSVEAQTTLATTQIINCNHCQTTPTVVRNSAGNYTIQPWSSGSYIWVCGSRLNSSNTGLVQVSSVTSGGVTIQWYNTAGSIVDPPTGTVTDCVGVSGT